MIGPGLMSIHLEKGNHCHDARMVHLITTMTKWIWTSRLPTKNYFVFSEDSVRFRFTVRLGVIHGSKIELSIKVWSELSDGCRVSRLPHEGERDVRVELGGE